MYPVCTLRILRKPAPDTDPGAATLSRPLATVSGEASGFYGDHLLREWLNASGGARIPHVPIRTLRIVHSGGVHDPRIPDLYAPA